MKNFTKGKETELADSVNALKSTLEKSVMLACRKKKTVTVIHLPVSERARGVRIDALSQCCNIRSCAPFEHVTAKHHKRNQVQSWLERKALRCRWS